MLGEQKVHTCGFVKLLDVFGSDESIEAAARISYGDGTRKKTETRGLLRYLMRHKHTSPLEMAEVQFHLKLPIFVMRQLVRHRTAALNEYSGRYSVMTDDCYVPGFDYIKPQSQTNKQGRGGDFPDADKDGITSKIGMAIDRALDVYEDLLELNVARELSRIVLPVSNYTECVWKIDLHNFFHFLTLRTDPHAQQEIQDYANAMADLVRPHFPLAFEAWEDYQKKSHNLSRMDINLLKDLLISGKVVPDHNHYGMSKREFQEMVDWIKKITAEGFEPDGSKD